MGRGDNADVVLRGDTISRNHALLTLDAEGFVKLSDLGSRNGTFVNGVAAQTEMLRDGDRVAFGADAVVDLRYGYSKSSAAANARRAAQPTTMLPHFLGAPASPLIDYTTEAYAFLTDLRTAGMGTAHPAFAVALDGLGCLYQAEGRSSPAAACHEHALDVLDKVPYIDARERSHSRVRLALALLELDRLDDAAEALKTAAEYLLGPAVAAGERLEYIVVAAQLGACRGDAQAGDLLRTARDEIERVALEAQHLEPKTAHLGRVVDRALQLLAPASAGRQ